MNTKKTTAFIVGAMLIATVLVMAVSAAGMDRSKFADMPRMVYEFDAVNDEGIYINEVDVTVDCVWDGESDIWVPEIETVPTLRIYGEEGAIYPTHSYYGTDDFVYPDPVDAFDPGIIAKDSVTFNPAYMRDAVSVDNYDPTLEADEKVFYRVFYEPGYAHGIDTLMEDTMPNPYPLLAPVTMPDGALVTETTYMMVTNGGCYSGDPLTGAADETRFKLPTLSKADPHAGDPGMDTWTADDLVNDDLVGLLFAENGSTLTDGTIEVGIRVELDTGESVRFMDHEITLVNPCGEDAMFDIGYIGNRDDREYALKNVSVPNGGPTVYVDRYHIDPLTDSTDAEHRWFVRNAVPDNDCEKSTVTIGRRLVAGETFYVDGVRYDMPAIYVTDDDEFKYITLQSPLPKCPSVECECEDLMDYSHVSCQWLAMLCMSDPAPGCPATADLHYVWVLPPFNDDHWKIDDINLAESGCLVDNITVNEAGEIFQYDDEALEFYYTEEDIEARFDSSLAERHNIRKDGVEIWNWWNVYTKPCTYTTLVLPDDEGAKERYCDWGYADGYEYIVTTSFIAPNSEADNRHADCKDPETHDIIDRAATIALGKDTVSRVAYNGTPRMVFEYDAVGTDDLFVNDDRGDPTVRVYGEAGALYPTHSMTDALDFIYPDAVDPFDPGVIAKDSVTFNPAYIDSTYDRASAWYTETILVDNANGDEKVFLRAFYEPGYEHGPDAVMSEYYPYDLDTVSMTQDNGPHSAPANGAFVTETTYMLLSENYGDGHAGDPKLGAPGGATVTHFMLPVGPDSMTDHKPGMEIGDMVDLVYAADGDIVTAGTIEVEQAYVDCNKLKKGNDVHFMDHTLTVSGFDTNEVKVHMLYDGNINQEHTNGHSVYMSEGDKVYISRTNDDSTSTNPAYRWYVDIVNIYYNLDDVRKSYVELKVGRRLVAGETFYVDGVRYDLPAIYVADGKFKYITFQSPMPKCDGPIWHDDVVTDNFRDISHVTSQWLANLIPGQDVPLLPPFNEEHLMIDDIDLDKSWNCGGTWENISVEEAGNILDADDWFGEGPMVDELEFCYIAEEAELRFDSSLAERHAYDEFGDEIWNWWSIFTKPYQYTELVLPDQETTGMSDGNEYLITTSFIAPNCEGAVRDMDNEPFCKPYDTHDIIDRASTLREGPDMPTLMEGDVTGDGNVTITDAMFIAQNVTGARLLDADQMKCADTTDEGSVTITDAMHIAQYVVDPDGSLSILFKPLWESPADDDMVPPTP